MLILTSNWYTVLVCQWSSCDVDTNLKLVLVCQWSFCDVDTNLKLVLVCQWSSCDVDSQLTLLHPEDQGLAGVGHPPAHPLLVHAHPLQAGVIVQSSWVNVDRRLSPALNMKTILWKNIEETNYFGWAKTSLFT